MSFAQELTDAVQLQEAYFPKYGPTLEGFTLATLTWNHALTIGDRGSGKSAASMCFLSMFHNVPIFSCGISEDTSLDDLFGMTIVNRVLAEGKRIRNHEGGLLTAVFAFLDELLDAPDMILRGALLTALNERRYMSKDDPIEHLPLHTVLGTTNWNRMTPALLPVLDRFLFQTIAPHLNDLTEKFGMYDTYLEDRLHGMPTLDYEGLRELANRVKLPASAGGVQISYGFQLMHAYLLQVFEERRHALGVTQLRDKLRREPSLDEVTNLLPPMSQRTENREFDLSRAVAVLNGRDAVVLQDTRVYKYAAMVLGANPDMEVLWDNVCAEVIPTRKHDVECLMKLGELTHQMHILRVQQADNTPAVNVIGGQLPTFTLLKAKEWLGGIRKSHPTIMAVIRQLQLEIESIKTDHSATSLPLGHDWTDL